MSRLLDFVQPEFVELMQVHYARNDPAHQWAHAMSVVGEADRIVRAHPKLEEWREIILLAALTHDCMSYYSREHHEICGAQYMTSFIYATQHEPEGAVPILATGRQISIEEVILLKDAILQHRASYQGERTHPVSQVVAAADRGRLTLKTMLRRAIQAKLSDTIDRQEVIELAIDHLVTKFGPEGYAWRTFPHEYYLYSDNIEEVKLNLGSAMGRDHLRLFAATHWLSLIMKAAKE